MAQAPYVVLFPVEFYQSMQCLVLRYSLFLEKHSDEVDEEEVGATEVNGMFQVLPRLILI